MKRKRIIVFLFLALFLRLFLATTYHHSDADAIYYWGEYLWEKKDFFEFIGKSVPNAPAAVYPPLFYYLLYIWRGLYFLIKDFFWSINVNIKIFPSSLIFWFENYETQVAFNKLIPIFTDFSCAYLIYKISFFLTKKEKASETAAIFFLFFPATWYLSAYWGQVDSLWGLFILSSFYLVLKNKFLASVFFIGLSLLLKQTGLCLVPLILLSVVKKRKFIDLLLGITSFLILWYVVYFPFWPIDTFYLSLLFYIKSFKGEINYLVSNSFNLWALIFGFVPRPDNIFLFGVSARVWGYLFAAVTSFFVYKVFWINKTEKILILTAFLAAFALFLFSVRMHERYFFATYIFLPILMNLYRKNVSLFILLSFIFMFNLYHLWWHPKLPLLIAFLSQSFVIKGIIIVNIGVFFYLLFDFLKGNVEIKRPVFSKVKNANENS